MCCSAMSWTWLPRGSGRCRARWHKTDEPASFTRQDLEHATSRAAGCRDCGVCLLAAPALLTFGRQTLFFSFFLSFWQDAWERFRSRGAPCHGSGPADALRPEGSVGQGQGSSTAVRADLFFLGFFCGVVGAIVYRRALRSAKI